MPGGMFILAEKSPPQGLEVEVEIVVPAFDLVPRPVRLRCIGQIRRVEMCYPLKGLAIAGRFVNESQVNVGFCQIANLVRAEARTRIS